MGTHVLEGLRTHLHAHYAGNAAPALTIDPGETVTFLNVPDVGWGLEPPTSTTAPRKKVERDAARDNGPCLCGPVAVRGASPGDMLEVVIEGVRPTPWGWTYSGGGMASPAWNAAVGLNDAPLSLVRWTIDRERGVARDERGLEAALRPFLGCIGLAGASEPWDGWTPRATGGNMDCRELTAGSRLYLPVKVAGGLLSIGDTHACQGDGEVAGTAVECGLEEARLSVHLHRAVRLQGPRALTPAGRITLGFGESLDEAAAAAMSAMLDWMVEVLSVPRVEAIALASAQVQLRITQVVNPARGVHAVWSENG